MRETWCIKATSPPAYLSTFYMPKSSSDIAAGFSALVEIFISYSHQDAALLPELKGALPALHRAQWPIVGASSTLFIASRQVCAREGTED